MKKIKTALISVFNKQGLDELLPLLKEKNIDILSTGGTYDYIVKQGLTAKKVETLTGYPSILGGRVKTLHPKVFGGILARTTHKQDQEELKTYEVPSIDLVIVDLYPFEETLAQGGSHEEIIEKIDIGGIALIRAAAKNYQDVLVISHSAQWEELKEMIKAGESSVVQRELFANRAFAVSSHYDTKIHNYFDRQSAQPTAFRASENNNTSLRYGENPHQKAVYFGNLQDKFEKLGGKEISYNNLVDIDAAVQLIQDFDEKNVFAILKHTNPCGVAIGKTINEAYQKALEGDPISAFGGVLIANSTITLEVARKIQSLFFEVLIAPDFEEEALNLLKGKKKRILLKQLVKINFNVSYKSLLGGVIWQEVDTKIDAMEDLKCVTSRAMTESEKKAVLFASKIVKHTKSNAIVLAKENQLFAHGVGQTSRVDALKQAIQKANTFGFDLEGAVMASDAFFPFPDCIEIAGKAGIKTVIQPGGSVRDQQSIEACDASNMAMVVTGFRHFKH